ncbi:hypothetical protein HO345_08600 [Treponema denticola]|uniref:hypothetical protein n=1 Tax=Treponema denticola TaxID=158 RepID=UPI0020A59F62|nr:hypothetical protein [Treponema denticola]UTD13037.1 hypothetical protein HO345_08600 [Treponema denticola]
MNRKNIFAVFVLFLTVFCINTMSCRDRPKAYNTYTVYTGKSTLEKYKEIFGNGETINKDEHILWRMNKNSFNGLKTELTGVHTMVWTQTEMETYLVNEGFSEEIAKKAINHFLTASTDASRPHKCLAYRLSTDTIYYLFR